MALTIKKRAKPVVDEGARALAISRLEAEMKKRGWRLEVETETGMYRTIDPKRPNVATYCADPVTLCKVMHLGVASGTI